MKLINNERNNKIMKASIIQPWKKYHREKPIRNFNAEQKFWKMLEDANNDNQEDYAINYLGIDGNDWTYKELFGMSNQLASAYVKAGIGAGDVVLLLSFSGMEDALNLIALNKIGAISKWVDITLPADSINDAIVDDKCKIVVCSISIMNKCVQAIENTSVEKVVFVNPLCFVKDFSNEWFASNKESLVYADFLSAHINMQCPEEDKYVDFINFLRTGDKDFANYVEYEKDAPSLKIQSSGTTGKPKTIVHTDYSINCSINKFAGTDLPLYAGDVLLKVVPSWVGYGLINSLAVGIAFGMKVLLAPNMDADLLFKLNGKFDVPFAVPLHYRYLCEHIDEIADFNRPIALFSGGDKITKDEVEKFEQLLNKKGCNARILNGAGSNEICGAGCVNPLNSNRPGSIGIPMWKDVVSIFDPETNEELDLGERGEICYRTEAMFAYYDNNIEETNGVKVLHDDGNVWIHTKDLGYQDEDGFIYIEGRLTRVITVGGFKISAGMIEDGILKNEAVKECVVVAAPDKEYREVPMAFIVLDKKYKNMNIEDDIIGKAKEHLKDKAVPKYFQFIDSIPYTSNNKQDYRVLENIATEYVLNGR